MLFLLSSFMVPNFRRRFLFFDDGLSRIGSLPVNSDLVVSTVSNEPATRPLDATIVVLVLDVDVDAVVIHGREQCGARFPPQTNFPARWAERIAHERKNYPG